MNSYEAFLQDEKRIKARGNRFEDLPAPFNTDFYKKMIIISRFAMPIAFLCVIQILYMINMHLLILSEASKTQKNIIKVFDVVFIITFLIASFSDPGSLERSLNEQNFDEKFLEFLPKCEKCGLPKPKRCHHCRNCGRCHLKMDHHCPALGQCVALRNQQKFMVMILWGIISALSTSFILIKAPMSKKCSRVFIYVMAVSDFALAVGGGYFYCINIINIAKNITTMEKMKDGKSFYSVGIRENLRQVFGNNPLWFFIPHNKPFISGFEWSLDEFNEINSKQIEEDFKAVL